MVVGDVDDFYGSHLAPIQTAGLLQWQRIMGGNEDHSVWMIKVAGNLAGAIAGQFVVFGLREGAEVFETGGGPQLRETLLEPVRALRPESLNCGAVFIGALEELAVAKGYLHKGAGDKAKCLPFWFIVCQSYSIRKHQPR